jgi:hypothetical protein
VARKLTHLLVAATFAAALAGSSASAALADSGGSCDPGSMSQPFLHWADPADYAEVPGGTFEAGLNWQASGGAKLASDNEPWDVSGDGDHALSLPAGASVTTPSFCGGLGYPTVRLFSKGGGLPVLTMLRVDVLYTGHDGLLYALPLGIVLPSSSWQPTTQVLTASGLPLLTGSRLALRITAVGAPFEIDDVYVDPFRRLR